MQSQQSIHTGFLLAVGKKRHGTANPFHYVCVEFPMNHKTVSIWILLRERMDESIVLLGELPHRFACFPRLAFFKERNKVRYGA